MAILIFESTLYMAFVHILIYSCSFNIEWAPLQLGFIELSATVCNRGAPAGLASTRRVSTSTVFGLEGPWHSAPTGWALTASNTQAAGARYLSVSLIPRSPLRNRTSSSKYFGQPQGLTSSWVPRLPGTSPPAAAHLWVGSGPLCYPTLDIKRPHKTAGKMTFFDTLYLT